MQGTTTHINSISLCLIWLVHVATYSTKSSLSITYSWSSHFRPQIDCLRENKSTHKMITRSQRGIFKKKIYSCYTDLLPNEEPHTLSQDISSPLWKQAITKECIAFFKNQTWHLEPLSNTINIVGNKWFLSWNEIQMEQSVETKLVYLQNVLNNVQVLILLKRLTLSLNPQLLV